MSRLSIALTVLALGLAPAPSQAWHCWHRCWCVPVVPVTPVAPATSYVPQLGYVPLAAYQPAAVGYAPLATPAAVGYAPGLTITSLAIAPQAAAVPQRAAAAPDCCNELRAAITDLRSSVNTLADQVQRHDQALQVINGILQQRKPGATLPRPLPQGPPEASIGPIGHLIGRR